MIEINQVKNGYILVKEDTTYVFQTMAELLRYVSEHFTHRQQEVLTDGPF